MLRMKLKLVLVLVALGIILEWEQEGVEARMGMGLGTWKNNALGKKKPWSRTKSEQKVWNRRPTSQRFREMEDEEKENNKIHSNNNGT